MPERPFEIRICDSCGLRYPWVQGQPFGTRCPACMGETRLVLHRELSSEPGHVHPPASGAQTQELAILLDNVRSAWNTGSILRSADGFGFKQAYLCGITPTPDNQAVTKTSLGAEDSIPWSYHKDAVRLVRGLKKMGHNIYALEEDKRSVDLRRVAGLPGATRILIVGNEITGVDPELLDLSDQILYIPMLGEKRSFNVAIAFGIAGFVLGTQ